MQIFLNFVLIIIGSSIATLMLSFAIYAFKTLVLGMNP